MAMISHVEKPNGKTKDKDPKETEKAARYLLLSYSITFCKEGTILFLFFSQRKVIIHEHIHLIIDKVIFL